MPSSTGGPGVWNPMGRRAPRSIAAALGKVRTGLEPPSLLAGVQSAWREVMGPEIAAVSQPVSERRGVVTVHCSDPVWAEELSLMEADLLARLAQRLGDASPRGLKFRFGSL